MIWAIFGSILLVLIAYLIYDNYHIEFKYFEQKSSFNLTICQISDLHSRKLNVGLIVKMIEKYKPDVIFYTGDMVDGIKDDLKISLSLIEALKDYPSFYVLGNHELRLDRKLSSYLASLALLGVRVLDNAVVDFKGIKIKGEKPIIKKDFSKINASYADIVLAHNPEGIKKYNGKYIFSGHAHGGQFRFMGRGLYSPGQGLFPKYTKGKYCVDDKVMFVSAGLGGKDFRIRLFNSPNINIVKFSIELK